MEQADPAVLIVDDEPRLAELFATWLEPSHPVTTANNGERALELIDDEIDIVLLDRRMPGLSGGEVLDSIRERGYDCRVVMVTAVDPDFDIVEMPFDDYLVKPVSKEELEQTIEEIHIRSTYDKQMRTLYSLASKRAVLESEKSDAELGDSAEYEEIVDRLDELRSEVDETVDGLSSHDEFAAAFSDVGRND